MIQSWPENLGKFNFEIGHNAGKVIPHAEFLSQVQTEENSITTVVATSTKTDTGIEKDTTNPCQILQHADQKSIKIRQKHLAKVSVWLENKQRPDKRQMTGASKDLWKIRVDFR